MAGTERGMGEGAVAGTAADGDAIESRVRALVREEIRALSAYAVPDATGMIKLDAMENPYRWPDALRRPWLDDLAEAPLNRYPDPRADALRARIARTFGVPPGQELMLGNGSDELIQLLCLAVAGPGRVVMAPEPGFVMYDMIARFTGMRYVGVPLDPRDFSLDLDAMLEAVARERPAILFLACPNNPTGNLFAADAIRRLIAAAPGLVVVDEAYSAFTDASFLPELGRHPNLLVMRTFSKLGLAGLRLGWLAGPGPWLRELDKLRLPYNINVLSQRSALFALEHFAVLEEQTARIRADRDRLAEALGRIPGIRVFPSEANFLLFRVPAGSAGRVHAGLRERGVLIKNLDRPDTPLADCMRVTVGTPAENAAFLGALGEILETP